MSKWNFEKKSNNDFKIIIMTIVIVFLIVIFLNGCSKNQNTACLDGYLYDKNEYGYKLKKEMKKC